MTFKAHTPLLLWSATRVTRFTISGRSRFLIKKEKRGAKELILPKTHTLAQTVSLLALVPRGFAAMPPAFALRAAFQEKTDRALCRDSFPVYRLKRTKICEKRGSE